MTILSTGPIKMSGVATELRIPLPKSLLNLGNANVRKLANKTSGKISMSDLRGKSWLVRTTKTFGPGTWTWTAPSLTTSIISLDGQGGRGSPASRDISGYQLCRTVDTFRFNPPFPSIYGTHTYVTQCTPDYPGNPIPEDQSYTYYTQPEVGNIEADQPNYRAVTITYGDIEPVYVNSPAEYGGTSTAFSKSFLGTYGGAAPVTNYANFAVTPGTTYTIVVAWGGNVTFTYDEAATMPPYVTVTSDLSTVATGQTANITFTLSDTSTNFALADISVTNGTLSGFSGSGKVYTAKFTPAANTYGPAVFTIPAGAFTSAFGETSALSTGTIVVNTTPVAGVELSTFCSGVDLMRRVADGTGGFTELVKQYNSPSCGYVAPTYPAAGTVLGTICQGFDLYNRVANGTGGYNLVLAQTNSTTCGYVPPPPVGTVIGTECQGFNLYNHVADGIGGYTTQLAQTNSTTCGYVAPSYPAYGTVLGTQCQGVDLYNKVADGYGNYTLQLAQSNSTSCGYVAPAFPAEGTILGTTCINFDLYNYVADGAGDTKLGVNEYNSPACGYVPPSAGPLTVSCTPDYQMYNAETYGGQVTCYPSATVSGGTAPYTYSWSFLYNPGGFMWTSSNQSTGFASISYAKTSMTSFYATVRCTVTDAAGHTASGDTEMQVDSSEV